MTGAKLLPCFHECRDIFAGLDSTDVEKIWRRSGGCIHWPQVLRSCQGRCYNLLWRKAEEVDDGLSHGLGNRDDHGRYAELQQKRSSAADTVGGVMPLWVHPGRQV